MHTGEATQYLLNLADKGAAGGTALRIAVERLFDNGDTETLKVMALRAMLADMEARTDAVLNARMRATPTY